MTFKYIPNVLSLLRLVLITPFLVFLYEREYICAFYLFLIASFTDGCDGWLARTFDWQSTIGSFIDPLADKLLVASSVISLVLIGILPLWLVILVFLRDLTISLGVLAWYWFIQKQIEFEPTLLSKINTFMQISLIISCLFKLAFGEPMPYLIASLILFTTLTTCATYIDYVYTWSKKAWSQKMMNKKHKLSNIN